MKRYFSSFFIAFFFYTVFAIFIFYLYSNEKIIINETQQTKTISLNHIALEPEVKQEIQKIEEQKKEIEKVVEKNLKIAKPIDEKKIIEKKVVEKQEVQTIKKVEEVATNTTVEKLEKPIVEEKAVQSKPVIDEKKEYLDKHLAQIRELINKNIKYPERAKKLSIEGVVVARFKILEDGSVENVEIIEGHKLLQNATIEAIQEASKSFPKTSKSIEIQIPVEYKLI